MARASDERRRLAAEHAEHRTRQTRDALIEAWYPLLRGTLRGVLGKRRAILLTSEDRPLHDELISAANLALVEAAESYDPSRGAGFGTWLWWRVKFAVLETLRQEGDMPRGKPRRMVSLDALLGDDGASATGATRDVRLAVEWLRTHPDDANGRMDRQRYVSMIAADIDEERTVKIVARVFGGEDVDAIAEDVGLTRSRVRAIVREAFREGRRLEEMQ